MKENQNHGRAFFCEARICQWLIGLTALGMLTGCGSNDADSGINRLKPRTVPYLDEVAVPQGFELVESLTYDYESGGQRNARHEYRGSADPFVVRKFYKEQMPMMGWALVSNQNVKGVITLRFEKKHEACVVEIRPGGTFSRTAVRVTVNPFNRSSLEPPKRPMP